MIAAISGRPTVAWVVLWLALAVLAGCSGAPPEKPLVVAFGTERVGLDPHFQDRSACWSVLSAFYDPLVAFTPELRLEPALAASWEQVDPTHWRFELRRGVRFHGGAELRADDVVASLERARTHTRSALRGYLSGVRSVRAEGDHRVVVETLAPAPDLVQRLTFVLVVPRRDAGREAITSPDGTSAYAFSGVLADGTVVARAWSGWRPRPEIAEVRFVFCGTDAEAARRLVAGEVDVSHLLPDDLVAEIAATPGLRVVGQPRLAVQLLSVHPEVAQGPAARALDDVRVRQALLFALDRERWVDRLYRGRGVVASQYVHPAVFGFDPAIVPAPTDLATARRLLAEAGFAAGFDVELRHSPAAAATADAVVSDLAQVGIRVTPFPIGTSPSPSIPGNAKLPLVLFAWACSSGDASDFFDGIIRHWRGEGGFTGRRRTSFPDEGTEELLAAAGREPDRDARLRLLQTAQRRVLGQLPLLPLTIREGSKGVSSRVEIVTRYDEREDVAAFRWRRE